MAFCSFPLNILQIDGAHARLCHRTALQPLFHLPAQHFRLLILERRGDSFLCRVDHHGDQISNDLYRPCVNDSKFCLMRE